MALTRCAAIEAAPHNVRVNAVVAEPRHAREPGQGHHRRAARGARRPARRSAVRAEPWEVANVIVFLASDYSGYMTGEVVSVSEPAPVERDHPWNSVSSSACTTRSTGATRGRPSRTSCGPSSTSCRRPTAPGSSTYGSPSTTSSTSTRTCRRTRRGWRTRSPSPTASTSARGSSTSRRRSATRRGSPRRWRCSTSSRRDASSSAPGAARRRSRCSASASTRWTPPATCTTRRCPRSSR